MTNELQPSIIEILSRAAMEKTHSQMLYWIFSTSSIDNSDKAEILKEMFNISKDELEIKTLKAQTEYKNIDLLIKLEYTNTQMKQEKKKVFVIENKIKSSEHSKKDNKEGEIVSQTKRYKQTIEDDKSFNDYEKHYCFLSLIGEQAVDKNWQNYTYSKLYNVLNNIKINKEKDNVFFKDYKHLLQNLTSIFDLFRESPNNYPNVFKNAGMSKADRINKSNDNNSDEQFISDNQLEVIFIKAFFIDFINESEIQKKLEKHSIPLPRINETRGKPLMQFTLKKIPYNGKNYILGWQLQNNTAKINFMDENYDSSKKKDIEGTITETFKHWFGFYKKDKKEQGWNGYKKINYATSKAYISISKKIDNYSSKNIAIELDDICEKAKTLSL